jgi:hypothetical protein
MTSININVSINYINNTLNDLLSINDFLINETILNYGVILYKNQYNIFNDFNNINNNDFNILKNEIKDNKFKFDEIIKKINHDNLINIDNIYLEKQNIEKNIRDNYYKKELEYQNIINNIENEKIIQRDNFLKIINDTENKIKNDYIDKLNSLENDNNKLKNEKIFEISSFIDKGKQITKDEYEKIIELHKILNNELKDKNNNLDKVIIQLQSNIQDLNNKLILLNKDNENLNYQSINNNINSLNNKFSNYFDKIFKGNTEKGNFGEDFIESYLTDKFTNSKIIDTHKESAKGDFLFIFDKLKTLIESKNVQILKKDDLDKFYRDIELRVSKNEINSALLISLNDTNLINGKRHFYFEIKFNIPIIMISNTFNNFEFIRFSILILNYLIKNGFANNETSEEKFIFIINCINEIYIYFKSQINYLNNDKQLILKLEESFRKRESDLFNIDKLFKNIFSKFPEINIQYNKSKNDYDDILNKIKNHISSINNPSDFKINLKNLESIGIYKNDVRNIGGIKVITDAISNIYI